MSDSYLDPAIVASAGWDSAYPETRLHAIVRMGQTDFMDCARSLFSMSLYDSSAQVRYAAMNALERMDEEAVVVAMEWEARLPDPAHRLAAIKLLGRRRAGGSIKLLVRYLNDKEGTVRLAALRALEQIGGERAARTICESIGIKGFDLEERFAALGRLKQPCALPLLFAAAQAGDWRLRAAAIQALGRIGDPWILEVAQDGGWGCLGARSLRGGLSAPSLGVSRHCARSLRLPCG